MWQEIFKNLGTKIMWVIFVVAGVALFMMGRDCGSKSRDKEVQGLSSQLTSAESTVKLKDGLYSTALVQMAGLNGLLDTSRTEVAALKKQLSDSQAQLLTSQQLTITWKNAYQGALAAHQSNGTTVPTNATTSGTVPALRTRVDFDGTLGPFEVRGYTLTNPAEAYTNLSQIYPLILTVAVAKNKDGTWSSYVTSSDKDVDVKVKLGGVDPGVAAPGWKQRIYLDAGVYPLGGKGGSLGVSYHFDRWSLGVACQDVGGIGSCGATAGFQIFR